MHPLDLLSGDEVPELRFFPGMALPVAKKLACVDRYLDLLQREFHVVSVGEHATLAATRDLPLEAPRFAS